MTMAATFWAHLRTVLYVRLTELISDEQPSAKGTPFTVGPSERTYRKSAPQWSWDARWYDCGYQNSRPMGAGASSSRYDRLWFPVCSCHLAVVTQSHNMADLEICIGRCNRHCYRCCLIANDVA